MHYIWQHIRTIIDTYDGSLPLAHFLKNYCKGFTQLGSRDRRILSEMAYCWYRCEKGIDGYEVADFEGKMKACLRVCGNLSVIGRLLGSEETVGDVALENSRLFPFEIPFSYGISKDAWLSSLLVQPSLFIRIRKQKTQIVKLLEEQSIPYQFMAEDIMSLPNGAKIDALLPPIAYVVQDASSQQTAKWFQPKKHERWYDCCSGAGGKSLLLKDLEPTVQLTVTDIRQSILHNLQERIRNYGHTAPSAYVTDVTDNEKLEQTLKGKLFDNIICDAPCSGSGTWARTPEQAFFFDPMSLTRFTHLQEGIATNVAQYLKPGGRLIYITCSVFEAENENVVATVVTNTGLQLIESKLINGVEIKADSMFVAVLRKM